MKTNDEKRTILADDAVRPLIIELHDWAGGVIARWELGETYEGTGGSYTLGAYMEAFECESVRAPFVIPGMDERAPMYFSIERIPTK